MGLFRFTKKRIPFQKTVHNGMEAYKNQQEMFSNMSIQELSALTDAELFSAVWARTAKIVFSHAEELNGFLSLNEAQRIFYAVNLLEVEVNNGGIPQFFFNSSRIVAPYVGDYMGIIGATAHKKLYDTFIAKLQINTKELSSFDTETMNDFLSQCDNDPFSEYDDAFYQLEPLEGYLISFIRTHIDQF